MKLKSFLPEHITSVSKKGQDGGDEYLCNANLKQALFPVAAPCRGNYLKD